MTQNMTQNMTQTAADTRTTAALVARFATRFNADYGRRHGVTSPLGLWLLLALAGPVTTGTARAEVEEVLGTSVSDARERAAQLLADPHPAVSAAVAAWADTVELLADYSGFAAALPAQVQQGPIPTQEVADAWASDHTEGLIRAFPLEITADTLLVLASALATDIAWRTPLDRVPSADLGGAFAEQVSQALHLPGGGLIVDTDAAGLVAVAAPQSASRLSVYSVIAAPEVPAARVHEAAHAVAELLTYRPYRPLPALAAAFTPKDPGARRVDLFDLPVGDGHAWTLTERHEVRSASGPVSEYESFLPAWSATSDHDLLEAPGVLPVLSGLAQFVRPEDRPAEVAAKQVARAEYTATGFKAAAVTAFGVMRSAAIMSRAQVPVRHASLRFNRPHAVIAVAASPATSYDSPWVGMPVFNAWVGSATEA